MAAITTGAHPKALWPGIRAWFGQIYNEKPMQCNEVFRVETSDKAYEEMVEATSFGFAPAKAEGASTTYEDHSQGYTSRFTHVAYSLGYIVTKEELDDNLYREMSRNRSRALAFSMRQTKETVCANIFNRGFNSSYTGGDGVELFSTAHPTVSGNQANEPSTATDFSEAALEDMLIDIRNALNNKGHKINIIGQKLVVPPALMFDAQRVVTSNLQSGTANNDTNALRSLGMLPQGIMVYDYLTDADAWFVQTDAPSGLCLFNRTEMQLTRDNDFDTENAKAKAYDRYVPGWADWRGIYGSPGA